MQLHVLTVVIHYLHERRIELVIVMYVTIHKTITLTIIPIRIMITIQMIATMILMMMVIMITLIMISIKMISNIKIDSTNIIDYYNVSVEKL